MKFLANMGISPATVQYLRELGHEAEHLHEQGLDELPDPDILVKARREQAVILTSDLDFGDLLAANQDSLPSVIIFRLRDMRPASVHIHLQLILNRHLQDLESGCIISVTERKLRIRALPI